MRVGLGVPDPQSAQTEKAANSAQSQPVTTSNPQLEGQQSSQSDHVTLSSLSTQAMQSPEVRQDRVDALRQSISSGQYQVDSNAIASAMLGL